MQTPNQIDPVLQEALRDEIDSMRHLVKLNPGLHCAFIAVVADNYGNLHVQYTGTEDPKAVPSLSIGISKATIDFIKSMDYRDAD